MRVLLVAAGGRSFGLAAPHVVELRRATPQELLTAAHRQVVVVHNELVPVLALTDILELAPYSDSGPSPPRNLLLAVVGANSQKLALIVDALLDEGDMLITPLPAHLRHFKLVSGVVTTRQNEIVSLLHAPVLIEQAGKLRRRAADASALKPAASSRVCNILVVDDSLNTREIEKDVLEAHGYRVTLAEDGRDGLQKAMAQPFDAVLTDVEMPFMDGFTLTEQLRRTAEYASTPIIIITSREKEADKRRGIQAGADAYIVKSDFEQNSLVETLRLLLG